MSLYREATQNFQQEGILSNALLLTNGSNNLYGTYNRKHAQLVFSQIENYQFFKHFSTDEKRTYITPTGNYHHLHIQDLSAIHQALTHGTTIKYNLSIENKFVFQTQVSLNLHNNPKQSATQMIEEDGLANYSTAKYTKDTYYSPSINLYLKKHMPQQREMIFTSWVPISILHMLISMNSQSSRDTIMR